MLGVFFRIGDHDLARLRFHTPGHSLVDRGKGISSCSTLACATERDKVQATCTTKATTCPMWSGVAHYFKPHHTPLWSECACGHWTSCSWEREKIRRGEPGLCCWRASPGLQPLVMDRSGDGGTPIPILLFGQLILELYRAHRLVLVVQKLAVERRLPLDSIELAGAACNFIHAIQCSRC